VPTASSSWKTSLPPNYRVWMSPSTRERHSSARTTSHYYLSVSLVVPGSQIPFVTEKEKDNATIDIIGEVREGGKFPVGQLRNTVKLAVDSTQQTPPEERAVQTGFVLAPGSYHLKSSFGMNQTGRIGSFETDVQIPDLRKGSAENELGSA